MEEVGQAAQLRAGELIIIVVVLVMWAGKNVSSLLVKILSLLQLWLFTQMYFHISKSPIKFWKCQIEWDFFRFKLGSKDVCHMKKNNVKVIESML